MQAEAPGALAREQPQEPSWPERAARLFRARADRGGELSAMRRALELQVDQGRVLDAIASCKAILDLVPDDPQTLETLDLLYMEDTRQPHAADAFEANAARSESSDDTSAALETLQLTKVVPGARAVQLAGPDVDAPGRVSEIPIDGDLGQDESGPLDLRLHPEDSGSDLRDLAAAQRVCLLSEDPLPVRCEELISDRRGRRRGPNSRTCCSSAWLDLASLHGLIRRVRVVTLEGGQGAVPPGRPRRTASMAAAEGAVVPIAPSERRRKLAVLERGEFFGEIGLPTGQSCAERRHRV